MSNILVTVLPLITRGKFRIPVGYFLSIPSQNSVYRFSLSISTPSRSNRTPILSIFVIVFNLIAKIQLNIVCPKFNFDKEVGWRFDLSL